MKKKGVDEKEIEAKENWQVLHSIVHPVRIRILRYLSKKEGATHYDYPTPHYDAGKVAFGPIYEGGLKEVVESDILPRNANDEFILIGVADADASEFLKADGFERDIATLKAAR